MELRHLRYFIAVAEAGSLTVAVQRMLHTSQPSLSRQIWDLEDEVGGQLLTRRARGIELTPAGRAFLEHARSVLSQVAVACKPAGIINASAGGETRWANIQRDRRLVLARIISEGLKLVNRLSGRTTPEDPP